MRQLRSGDTVIQFSSGGWRTCVVRLPTEEEECRIDWRCYGSDTIYLVGWDGPVDRRSVYTPDEIDRAIEDGKRKVAEAEDELCDARAMKKNIDAGRPFSEGLE